MDTRVWVKRLRTERRTMERASRGLAVRCGRGDRGDSGGGVTRNSDSGRTRRKNV